MGKAHHPSISLTGLSEGISLKLNPISQHRSCHLEPVRSDAAAAPQAVTGALAAGHAQGNGSLSVPGRMPMGLGRTSLVLGKWRRGRHGLLGWPRGAVVCWGVAQVSLTEFCSAGMFGVWASP